MKYVERNFLIGMCRAVGNVAQRVAGNARALLLAAALALAGCAAPGYGPGAGRFSTVVVDAGHGGHDRGARSVFGMNEKLLTLDTAQRLAAILRERGYRVVVTRPVEEFVTLGRRVALSNAAPNAIFVSVHYNWARRRAASGIETYYFSPRARRLAANIQREVVQAYPTRSRGVKRRGYYVLRNNRRPAVLVECGFVSGRADNSYVQNPEVRQRIAEKIANGIVAERAGRRP